MNRTGGGADHHNSQTSYTNHIFLRFLRLEKWRRPGTLHSPAVDGLFFHVFLLLLHGVGDVFVGGSSTRGTSAFGKCFNFPVDAYYYCFCRCRHYYEKSVIFS